MMRKLFVIIFCFSPAILLGQKKDLPVMVKDSLMHKYPAATGIKSKKQKDNFRIRFENNGIKTVSIFDASGNWAETESTLKNEDLPEKVSNSVKKKYPQGIISSANLKETSSGMFLYYIMVDTEKSIFNLELDRNGKIIGTKQIRKETVPDSQDRESGSGEE